MEVKTLEEEYAEEVLKRLMNKYIEQRNKSPEFLKGYVKGTQDAVEIIGEEQLSLGQKVLKLQEELL